MNGGDWAELAKAELYARLHASGYPAGINAWSWLEILVQLR